MSLALREAFENDLTLAALRRRSARSCTKASAARHRGPRRCGHDLADGRPTAISRWELRRAGKRSAMSPLEHVPDDASVVREIASRAQVPAGSNGAHRASCSELPGALPITIAQLGAL